MSALNCAPWPKFQVSKTAFFGGELFIRSPDVQNQHSRPLEVDAIERQDCVRHNMLLVAFFNSLLVSVPPFKNRLATFTMLCPLVQWFMHRFRGERLWVYYTERSASFHATTATTGPRKEAVWACLVTNAEQNYLANHGILLRNVYDHWGVLSSWWWPYAGSKRDANDNLISWCILSLFITGHLSLLCSILNRTISLMIWWKLLAAKPKKMAILFHFEK